MPLTTFTVWQGGAEAEMVQAVQDARDFFLRHGSQEVSFHRIHTGARIGQYLLVQRYPDWSTFGRAQDGWATDAWYKQHGVRVRKMAQMVERTTLVELALGEVAPAAGQPPVSGSAKPVHLLVRYQGGDEPDMIQAVKDIHAFFLQHGIQKVRFHRFHNGPHIGEYLLELYYPDWATFGRAQTAWATDTWYKQHGAKVQAMTRTAERTFAVALPLG